MKVFILRKYCVKNINFFGFLIKFYEIFYDFMICCLLFKCIIMFGKVKLFIIRNKIMFCIFIYVIMILYNYKFM